MQTMGRWTRQFSLRFHILAALVLACNFLLVSSPVAAQGDIDQALFERLRWARFELVRGRLEVRDIRRGQNRSITVDHHEIMVREHISFRIDNQDLLLHYERTGPQDSLILDVHGNIFDVHRVWKPIAYAIEQRLNATILVCGAEHDRTNLT